jgi:hypothetical protein
MAETPASRRRHWLLSVKTLGAKGSEPTILGAKVKAAGAPVFRPDTNALRFLMQAEQSSNQHGSGHGYGKHVDHHVPNLLH